MANYFYNKYNVVAAYDTWSKYNTNHPWLDVAPWVFNSTFSNATNRTWDTTYTFSSTSNKYKSTISSNWPRSEDAVGMMDYTGVGDNVYGTTISRTTKMSASLWQIDVKNAASNVQGDAQGSLITSGINAAPGTYPVNGKHSDGYWYVKTGSTPEVKGSLVQANIIAADGAYPTNGKHTDGYWYVRGAIAFPELKINIGGAIKTSVDGWVNIGGTLRHIEAIWINVGGVLKKL